ncbi:NAD-dependent succinate-semialdehyde dehydrogenase [Bacillus gobiensis]|uniref:NAD-dependent succinate-semialdehyde dehydrogenase n=1 Tax=Bacillus gobiensis TaxID=1441095 RepID=UPI003D1E40B0
MKPLYINGDWVTTKNKLSVHNPATGEIVSDVAFGGKEEAQSAVDAADKAFSTWSKATAKERSDILKRWFSLIQDHKESIGRLMTSEQGKPLPEAIGEVEYANSFVEWYAEEGKRVYGDIIPTSFKSKRIYVTKQPIGVIAAITPWNFPAAMITRKIAPALAAGCTAVIKPAEETPLTALRLAELAHEAGIPKGVLNVVLGEAQEIAEVWQKDPRIRKISFTGSTEVGKILMRGASQTVKKVSFELGGHAPFIVFPDTDLDFAVNGLLKSKFRNAGQTCVCTNRVYVHDSIYEQFVQKTIEKIAGLKVGSGLEEGITIGPLINHEAKKKVQSHIKDAEEKGGQLYYHNNQTINDGDLFVPPVVISNANDDMLCMNEETFGPVAPIARFQTADEVIKRANDTPYGLAAYLYTDNLSDAIKVSEGLDYGIIGVNDSLPSVVQAPFGGMKESGIGREGGYYGIEEYLETKYTSIRIR